MIIILIAVAFLISGFHIFQICLPSSYIRCVFGTRNIDLRIVIRLIKSIIPITAGKTLIIFLGIIRTGKRRVTCPIPILAVQIGGTVRNQNQVFFIGRDILMFFQGFLTGQKAGVDICTAGIFIFQSCLYRFKIRRKIKPGGFESPALELHNADIHGSAAIPGSRFQCIQKGKRRSHYIGISRRRTIQHEHHIGFQLFFCAGQRKRYVRRPSAGVQRGCCLGFRSTGYRCTFS